jgi:hypothetical protein
MRLIVTSVIVGPLMLIGSLPAAAGQSTLLPVSPSLVQLASSGEPTADRESFIQSAREKTAEWQQKLQDLKTKADANGNAAANSTEDDLHKAWIKVEAASRQLQTVSAEGWNQAKIDFDKASHDLAQTWHKIHPEEK